MHKIMNTKHVKTSKEIKQDAKTKVKQEKTNVYKLKEERQPMEVKRTKLSLFGEDSYF